MAPNPAPYPYGQLPGQHFSVPVQNSVAHPLPGSYNRPLFNPQTRSFVPGGGTSSARYSGKGPQHGANASYAGSQASGQQPWTGYPDNHNHGQPATHMSPHAGNRNSNNAAPSNVNPPRGPSSGNQDSIAKWGTPAHLPPKPPPSEVPSDFDIKGRNSSSSSHSYQNNIPPSSKNGPLVVSGGTGAPKSSWGLNQWGHRDSSFFYYFFFSLVHLAAWRGWVKIQNGMNVAVVWRAAYLGKLLVIMFK